MVFLWWCFCGDVFVVMFLLWCCGGVFIVVRSSPVKNVHFTSVFYFSPVKNVNFTPILSVRHVRSDERVARPPSKFAFALSFERSTRPK